LKLTVQFETDTRVHVKFEDMDKPDRYQVPESVFPRPQSSVETNRLSAAYQFILNRDPFSFKIIRKSDGEPIFDTSSPGGSSVMNPLIFEDQFLELSTRLSDNPHVYGYALRNLRFKAPFSFSCPLY
jgi:alpha-glucosidase